MDFLLGIQITAILLGLIGHAASIVRLELARVSRARDGQWTRPAPMRLVPVRPMR